VRRVVAGTGKFLITLGILILLFVAYQLWGTGIYTARQQHKLENQFNESLHQAGPTRTSVPATAPDSTPTTTTTAPPLEPPDSGAVAHIVIPKIDVDKYVVEGVSLDDLRNGPGHYPSTPFPGQAGNSAIAGHRTTYGAPFNRIPDLEPGDVIKISTVQGEFEYVVYDGFPVSPDDVSVLDADPKRPATLTLTTCHPEYQAAQRYIIKAQLKLPPNGVPLPSTVDPNDPKVSRGLASESLSGHSGSKTPTLLAALLMLLVGLLWWLLFHRHPRWTTWFIGAVPFAITLAIFYFYLERALPANY